MSAQELEGLENGALYLIENDGTREIVQCETWFGEKSLARFGSELPYYNDDAGELEDVKVIKKIIP